jgi:glycosyltransferase involved in cell wall biosynthesis
VLFGVTVIVVVPAFNEEARIGRVIGAMPPEVDRIVVVDDASEDGTRAAALLRGDPRVAVLSHEENRGVGASIATGYRSAAELAGPVPAAFVVMAGDGQMDPGDLPTVVRPIAEGRADYVKGCRFDWPGASEVIPIGRRVGGEMFSRATSVALGQRIRDSQCGYTALSRAAASRLDLAGLWPRFGYPNDLLGQLVARRMRIVEVPVRPVYADEVSRLRVRHLPRIGALIARAWLRRLTSARSEP